MYATVARTQVGFKATLGAWKDAPPGWKYRPYRWIRLTTDEVAALDIGDYEPGE